jgi:hypothetical protein
LNPIQLASPLKKRLRSGSCRNAAAARGDSNRKSPASSGIFCRAPQLISA